MRIHEILFENYDPAPILDNPEFQAWFAGSKMVDRSGTPRVFYHGTPDAFTEFDPKAVHDRDGLKNKLGFGPGLLYFTDMPADASRYAARWKREGANIHPVFLKMTKPLVTRHYDDKGAAWIEHASQGYGSYRPIKTFKARMRKFIQDLKAEGHDGIAQMGSVTHSETWGRNQTPGEFIVFDASQVRSVFSFPSR